MKELFGMLSRYNAWANQRLLHSVEALDEDAYRTDCGAAFGSVHGTMNHLLVGDRIWLARFTGDTGEHVPAGLDEEIASDRAALRCEREATDGAIIQFVDGLTEDDLARSFAYRRAIRPEPVTQKLAPALLHTFNHQTHHRGQIHAMLTRLTGEAPALDLIYYQREASDGT
jgi:uncharacterized damage-inducible protein DinB